MAEVDYTAVRVRPMRKVIAQRMTEALRTIPHYRVSTDINVGALTKCRTALHLELPSIKLSLNDLIVKACAATLIEHPTINMQWAEEEIRQFHVADIAVVTAVPGGISTPIVREADRKSVWEISEEIRDSSHRAARGQLKMEDILGGSFSISNLGMFGVAEFDAIINAPQGAILAVGAAQPLMVSSPEGIPSLANIMRVTLSADHRAIDGAPAAQFLAALKERIEKADPIIFKATGGAPKEACIG